MKVLVIGDAIVDTNIIGECNRVSPEGPYLVVEVQKHQSFLGGAANVASHIASAGIPCVMAYKCARGGFFGEPEGDTLLMDMLSTRNIHPVQLAKTGTRGVPHKKRVLAGNQQVVRIDYEDTEKPDVDEQESWLKLLTSVIERHKISVILFSDYNKGTLCDPLLRNLIDVANEKEIPTILDPKRPSFHTLKGLTMVKPNVREMESTNLTPQEVSRVMGNTYVINTIGKAGVCSWRKGKEEFYLPSFATNVVDVCGCGDTFEALLGIATFKGMRFNQAVVAGNTGASFAIQHRGTYVLTPEEIQYCLDQGLKA